MLEITPGDHLDVLTLAARLMPADAAELEAAGFTVEECLQGVELQALRYDGTLVCLFGAVPAGDGLGVPWMLCTTDLQNVPRHAMALVSAKVAMGWRERFTRMVNLVHRHNEQAIRFVRYLGFRVLPEPAGPGGAFYVFEWEKGDV